MALGSNLGSEAGGRRVTLSRALSLLGSLGCGPARVSRFFATPAFPAGNGPDYVNACAALRAPATTPEAVLETLHRVERAFGRARTLRWGARTLDLDLVAFGAAVRPDAETQARWVALDEARRAAALPGTLILPHPRLAERAFVLVPLCDIAPGWRHPVTGRSAAQMRDALPAARRAEVVPI